MGLHSYASNNFPSLKKPIVSAISFAAMSLLLAGCSSGGGKGGGDDGIHVPEPSPSPSPNPVPDAEVRIGVLDSGFRTTHEAIADKIYSQINLLDFSEDVSTEASHGTAVAGIAVDTSPDGELMLAKVAEDGSGGAAATNVLDHGVYHLAKNNARVINVSYSSRYNAPHPSSSYNGVNSLEGLREIVTSNDGKGSVYVASAGNDGVAISASRPIYEEADIFSRMLIAGGLSSDGNRHSQSNYPGADEDFQSRFLMAPWTALAPYDTSDDDYAYWGGTSMSAPRISGYAAEIIHLWPHLDAVETSQLLLDTADKSHDWYDVNTCGESGDLNCGYFYLGQGVANLDEALKPQGEIRIPTGEHLDEGGVSVKDSSMSLSAAFGTQAHREVGDIAVFDELGRDYQFDVGSGITSSSGYEQSRIDSMTRLSEVGQGRVSTERHMGKDFAFAQRYRGNGDILASRFDVTLNDLTMTGFQLSGNERSLMDIREQSGFMPMMSWQGGGLVTHSLGEVRGFSMSQSIFSPDLALSLTHWSGASDADHSDYSAERSDMSVDWSLADGFTLRMGVSRTAEDGGLLGSTGRGEMAFSDDNEIDNYHASVTYHLTPSLSGFATYGMGKGDAGGAGMIKSVSGIQTSEMALGLQWQSGEHQVGLALSQPAYVEDGTMKWNVPVGRDLEGNVLRESRDMELSPSGRQRDIEIGYSRSIGNSASWAVNVMHTIDPGHDATAPSDTSAVISAHKLF